jgi:hypothetical protein
VSLWRGARVLGQLVVAAEEGREESKQVEQEGDHRAEIVAGSEPTDQPLARRRVLAKDNVREHILFSVQHVSGSPSSLRHHLGRQGVMFATDFPHKSDWPNTPLRRTPLRRRPRR